MTSKRLFIAIGAAVAMMATNGAFSQQGLQHPQPQISRAGVQYVSGGIGLGSQQEMKRIRKDYNLRLTFARPGSGEYLSDVRVRAENSRRRPVLDVHSRGPFFFARLPSGMYHITAEFEGKSQDRVTRISEGYPREIVFYFTK